MRNVIDLGRYPLDQIGNPDWQSLVERCRGELAKNGLFSLEGFLRPQALATTISAIAPRFQSEAFTHRRRHNIYFKPDVPGLGPDHPALRQVETVNHTRCGDQLAGLPIRQLYDWPAFAAFLAAVMDRPALHVMDDPLACLNTMANFDGEALNWHFDRSEFTTTLLLQAPDAGGDFEYRTDLRSDIDPNYDGVARLLRGEGPDAQMLHLGEGTLNVFRGKNTPHRVTPVKGNRARIIAVFSYYERAGVRFSPEEQLGFYGRTA